MTMKLDLNSEEQHYLDRCWDLLAAIGWKEFSVRGRGAVLVYLAEPNDSAKFIPMEVLAGNPVTEEYARMVREYDPRREIVVIFMVPPLSVTAFAGALPKRETPLKCCQRYSSVLFGRS